MTRQKGLGLVELLISLFLSSILILGLMAFYSAAKNQHLRAEKNLDTHFDLQWVQDLLRDDIRRAGFTPCVGIDLLHFEKNGFDAIKIENNSQQGIYINRMSEYFAEGIQVVNSKQILVSSEGQIDNQDRLLITDCEHAEVQYLKEKRRQSGGVLITLTQPLQFPYTKPFYVGRFFQDHWFIKNNKKGEPALYYDQAHAEEITSEVQDFKARKIRQHGKQFIELILYLTDGSISSIITMVRGS